MSTSSPACAADLYDGAYGLTLRLFIPSDQHLDAFIKSLQAISGAEFVEQTLENEGHFILTGVGSVRLNLHNGEAKEKTVFLDRKHKPPCIEWGGNKAQWSLRAATLTGFESGKPAHHYLSTERIDDVLIEVSYLGG